MSNEITILLENASATGQITSEKQPGAGYHQKYDNLHTFVLRFSNWDGEIKLQGTLEMFPSSEDWFDLRDSTNTLLAYGGDSSDYDGTFTANARGNFVWIRAVGVTNSGIITEIRYNH
jgi:hypothetical protein